MAIKQLTPKEQVDAYLDEELRRREQALIYNLAYVGEKCVNIARNTTKASKNFLDQTGNLRSSIGYVIADHGRVVQSSTFQSIKEGAKGATEGAGFARKIARRYTKGVVLILVAGMDYAVHVQNKGYDVTTSAELLAESLVPKILKQLGLE